MTANEKNGADERITGKVADREVSQGTRWARRVAGDENGTTKEPEANVTDGTPSARINSAGGSATPARGVPALTSNPNEHTDDIEAAECPIDLIIGAEWEPEVEQEGDNAPVEECTRANSVGAGATPSREVHDTTPILLTETVADLDDTASPADIYDTEAYGTPVAESIYTRTTNPFKSKRVAKILELVEIGPDLTEEQRGEVQALVREYADIFALAVSEVSQVKGAVYAPKIPEGRTFSTKVQQRPLTKPQAEYLHQQVEVLEEAGIIRRIHPRDVKCVSP
ncbi:hypothetical protein C8R44DRAFT_638720, partial [Mycena epipterygia]